MAIWPWKKTEKNPEEHLISQEQASELVRADAAAYGESLSEPLYFAKEYRQIKLNGSAEPVKRPVYVIRVGSTRPLRFVDMDAIDGTILAWRTLPR